MSHSLNAISSINIAPLMNIPIMSSIRSEPLRFVQRFDSLILAAWPDYAPRLKDGNANQISISASGVSRYVDLICNATIARDMRCFAFECLKVHAQFQNGSQTMRPLYCFLFHQRMLIVDSTKVSRYFGPMLCLTLSIVNFRYPTFMRPLSSGKVAYHFTGKSVS